MSEATMNGVIPAGDALTGLAYGQMTDAQVQAGQEILNEYVAEVVAEALAAEGVDRTQPGFHAARFVATRTAHLILADAVKDEQNQATNPEGVV